MKSVSLINLSGRMVRVPDNRVPHLIQQGFTYPNDPEPAAPAEPSLEDLDRGALAAMAESRDLEFHPRLGKKRLIELLSAE